MHLVRFECEGFRGLTDVCFEPSPGLNVIRGNNAQGKTSLLEAILFTATSKSHRTTLESDLVRYGEDRFSLTAQARRRDRQVAIDAQWWQGVKRFKVNGIAQTRISDILGKISVVLFSPEDLVLVKGAAAQRRRFLDMELSQIQPPYLNALQQYRQILRQRNEVLRHPSPDLHLIEVWDAQLAAYGDVLIRERDRFVSQLAGFAADAYQRLAPGEPLELAYQPNVAPDESLAAALAKTQQSDLRRGLTTRGPHRDDLEIRVAGQPARNFASQGQQKTAALALKLAELTLVRERTGEYPVLMLDEVLSELDADRSRLLFHAIDPEVQCLLTSANLKPEDTLSGLKFTHYSIERGRLEKS